MQVSSMQRKWQQVAREQSVVRRATPRRTRRITCQAYLFEKHVPYAHAPVRQYNELDALRSMGELVLEDGTVELTRRYQPAESTVNASVLARLLKQGSHSRLEAEAQQQARVGVQPCTAASLLSVSLGCELLQATSGRLTVQLDARLAHDAQAMIDEALYLAELFESKGVDARRLYLSLPSTWQGLQACRLLHRQGIQCSMAAVVSLAQAAAAAEAGAAVVAPAVGLVSGAAQQAAATSRDDAGVALTKRVYKYYKRYGYRTAVMPAGLTSVAQVRALAGCDKLSLSASLMAELAGSDAHLPKVLWPSMGGCGERQAEPPAGEAGLARAVAQEGAGMPLSKALRGQVAAQEQLEGHLEELHSVYSSRSSNMLVWA